MIKEEQNFQERYNSCKLLEKWAKFFLKIFLFIWLCRVFAAPRGVFPCSTQTLTGARGLSSCSMQA